VEHYNQKRPHRALQLLAPESPSPPEESDGVPDVQRRDVLGGLIHEYVRAASSSICTPRLRSKIVRLREFKRRHEVLDRANAEFIERVRPLCQAPVRRF
jgi:hypothetical protein